MPAHDARIRCGGITKPRAQGEHESFWDCFTVGVTLGLGFMYSATIVLLVSGT